MTGATAPADASATGAMSAAGAVSPTVQADWAKYDTGNKGSLTPLEFGKWVLAASGNDMSAQVEKTRQSKAKGLPAVKVLNATATQFSKADTDKDRTISPAELTAFLGA
jgi:penicillin V acylase-like amidase (Ntn superfamily)